MLGDEASESELRERLAAILRSTPPLMRVLSVARRLCLPDWLVFSGAVYQPVLNHLTLMSEVKGRGSDLAFRLTAGSVSRNCNWLHRAGDGALRRRSIKLLFAGSAFRVSVSGLVLCLKGGRRAQAWPRS